MRAGATNRSISFLSTAWGRGSPRGWRSVPTDTISGKQAINSATRRIAPTALWRATRTTTSTTVRKGPWSDYRVGGTLPRYWRTGSATVGGGAKPQAGDALLLSSFDVDLLRAVDFRVASSQVSISRRRAS